MSVPAWAKLLAMLVVTAAFVAALLRFSDVAGIRHALVGMRPAPFAVGVAITMATITLRAVRASLAVEGTVRRELMAVSIVHNALSGLLPMKLGELALPYLLHRLGLARAAEGIGVLLLLRGLDFASLLLVGTLAVLAAFGGRLGAAGAALTSTLAAAMAFLLLVFACWNAVARWLHDWPLLRRWPLAWRVASVATQLDRRQLARLFGLSMAIWLSLFASLYFYAVSVYPAVSPVQAAAAGSAASLAFAFPISGFANTGPFQAAWLWMSLAMGLEQTPSLAASLLAHGAVVAVTTLLGTVALVPLAISLRRQRVA